MNLEDILKCIDSYKYKTKLYMSPATSFARCFIVERTGLGTVAYGQGTTRHDAAENAYRQLMDRGLANND